MLGVLLSALWVAGGQTPTTYIVDQAQLTTRTDRYLVSVEGRSVGWTTYTLQVDRDAVWFTHESIRDENAVLLGTSSGRLLLAPVDLTVRRMQGTETTGDQTTGVTLSVDSGRVRARSSTGNADVAAGSGIYELTSLHAVIPALPLETGSVFALPTYVSALRSVRPIRLRVRAPKKVKVPAGEFEAFKVEMSGYGEYDYYVSTATPRRIVKIVSLRGRYLAYELVND